MDFQDSESDRRYRQQVRSFLESNAEPLITSRAGGGSMAHADVEEARLWRRTKAAAGYSGIVLPREYGGAGGTIAQQIIFDDEEGRFDVPSDVHFFVGTGICAPAILAYGTGEQKERYLPPLIQGDELWCQLFSEPSSGSDLASIRTRATRADGGWVINGQKIWTSFAHLAQFGLLLARTDPDVPKHKGISAFLVDMSAEGVAVQPIKQISGNAHFNEVFFQDVLIPEDALLGELNQGWAIALLMLMNERLAVGRMFLPSVAPLMDLAMQVEWNGKTAIQAGDIRQKLATFYCEQKAIEATIARVMTALSQGREPGPEASVIKVVDANREFAMADLAIELAAQGQIPEPDMQKRLNEAFLDAPGTRIAGGTEEILLNTIGERVLGLPREKRPDRHVPFSELP